MNAPGLYRGICSNSNDPEGLSRIRLLVPQILGTHETTWAWPCVPPGWFSDLHQDHVFTDNDTGTGAGGSATETLAHTLVRRTPAPGEGVWVMFEGGDTNKPVWMGVWK
jgi:hypothetical protein